DVTPGPDGTVPEGTTGLVPAALPSEVDPATLVPAPPTPAPGEGEGEAAEDEGQQVAATPDRLLDPLPASVQVMASPTLEVALDDCTLQMAAETVEAAESLTLLTVPPAGGAFLPLLDLGPIGAGEEATAEVPVVPGKHTFVVAGGPEGQTATWSELE